MPPTAPVPATPGKPGSILLSPRLLLFLFSSVGLLAMVLSPYAQIKLGLFTYGHWFLDTFAILAASDAVHLGHNPYIPNPLDYLNRPHVYTHWWFAFGQVGLTRANNFLVGSAWVLGFVGTFLATVRPKLKLEAVWYAALLLSPPVLLAIMRGNNDLVVFIAIGLGGLAMARPGAWPVALAIAGVGLATGLKFYPVVAAAGLLLVRPATRLRWSILGGVGALVLVWINVWPDFKRVAAIIPMSGDVYSFGAPLLLQDYGLTGRAANLVGLAVLVAGGSWLAWRGQTSGLGRPDNGDVASRYFFAVGAAVLAACFVAGISYAYRWIFALWLAPWLWHEYKAGRDPLGKRIWGGTGLLLTVCLWSDGIFCLVVNLLPGPIAPEALTRWQFNWRLASQPANWMLMILLTGWLIEMGWGALREIVRRAAQVTD